MDSLTDRFAARGEDFDRPVLVTGSGGCIGSWTLAILVRAGVSAVAYDLAADRRRPGLLMTEEELGQVAWEQGDIADHEAIDRVVSAHGIGAIIHLAALQVPFCRADPVAGARVNVVGTVGIFEAARRHGLRRLTYASSVAAHGAAPDTRTSPLSTAPTRPATRRSRACTRGIGRCRASASVREWSTASAATRA